MKWSTQLDAVGNQTAEYRNILNFIIFLPCIPKMKYISTPLLHYKINILKYQVLFQNANLRKVCGLYVWFPVSIVPGEKPETPHKDCL